MPEKTAFPNEIKYSRAVVSTKIHDAVDAYGNPIYIMISDQQRNNINYAIPILEHINIKNSSVLANHRFDNTKLID